MTPIQIESLLKVYYNGGKVIPDNTQASNEAFCWLADEGLAHETDDADGYVIDDRGRAMVGMLTETPLPRRVWADPRKEGVAV